MAGFFDFLTGDIQSAVAPSAEPKAGGDDIASRLKSDLQRDFGLADFQAGAFVGNLAHESGGFKSLQEINPMVPGSRGGYGYAQWTGPRRRQFEAWTAQNGLDPTSYEANYGFLKHELSSTPEGRVLNNLRQSQDPVTATQIVSDEFLRPGIPGMSSRQKWTQRVMGGDPIGAFNPTITAAAERGRGPAADRPARQATVAEGQMPMARSQPVDTTSADNAGILEFLRQQAGQGQEAFPQPAQGGLGGLGGFRAPVGGDSSVSVPASVATAPVRDVASLIPSSTPNPFAFFGKPAQENQQAAAERDGKIALARMLVAKGATPEQAAGIINNPAALQMFVGDKQRAEAQTLEREKFDFQKENVRRDNDRADAAAMSAPRKILKDLGIEPGHPDYVKEYKRLAGLGDGASAEVAQRQKDAIALGLKPDDPGFKSYVLTGKMPREDAQPLSATDKKAIMEADEGVLASETAIKALNEAKALSPRAFGGAGAGIRAMVGNALPDGLVPDVIASREGSQATTELENIVMTNALGQLKSIFGAAPTEGERKILLDIQGSVGQPDKVRQAIYDRAIKLAETRLGFNRQRAAELRGGTYYKQGEKAAQSGAPAAPAPAPSQAQQPAAPPDRATLEAEARRRGLLK